MALDLSDLTRPNIGDNDPSSTGKVKGASKMAYAPLQLDQPGRELRMLAPNENKRSAWIFTYYEKGQRPYELLAISAVPEIPPATIVNMLLDVLKHIVDEDNILWLRNSWDGKMNLEILRRIEEYNHPLEGSQ